MSVVAAPAYLPRKYRLAKLALALLLALGLMSFAAVSQMKVECGPVLLTGDDGVTLLTTDDGKLLTTGEERCQVSAGGFSVPLPEWLSRMFW